MDPEPVIAADDPQFELALDRAYGRLHLGSTAPAPRYQMTQAGRPGHRPLAALAGLPALMGTKALAAAAVVTLAGTAVGVKTVVTGSPSPINWGQQVKTQVQTCKDQLRPDQHGIGQCVSTFAQQHGQAASGAHSNAGGNGKGKANGPPTSPGHSGQGQAKGRPSPNPGGGRSGSHPSH